MSLEALDIKNGETTESGPLASSTRASITSRYPFQQAYQLGLDMHNRIFRKKIETKLSYISSQKNQFQLVKLNSRVDLDQRWSMSAELLTVDASDLSKENRNEIAQYTNNDQLAFGVNYDF
jgi:hypothetical protein